MFDYIFTGLALICFGSVTAAMIMVTVILYKEIFK